MPSVGDPRSRYSSGTGPFSSDLAVISVSYSSLVAGLVSSTVAALINGGLDFGQLLPGVTDALLTVGAPTVVGIMAVNALDSTTNPSSPAVKSLLAGTFAVATMLAVGALPATIDLQTIYLIGICASGPYLVVSLKL